MSTHATGTIEMKSWEEKLHFQHGVSSSITLDHDFM